MANRISSILFGYLLVVAVVLQFVVGQSSGTTHTVGEEMGWTIPSTSDAYSTWASSKNFVVGDTLLFNFPGVHTVAEVSKAAYDACNTKSIPIGGSILSTSPSTIRLNTAGAHFYIFTVGEHCMFGQKLFINVNGINRTTTTTPSTTATTPSPTPTPPSTTITPSPSTPTTPPPTTAAPLSSTIATPPSTTATPLSSTATPLPSTTSIPPSSTATPTTFPSTETPNVISVAPTEGPTSTATHGRSSSSSSQAGARLISLTLLFTAALVVFL